MANCKIWGKVHDAIHLNIPPDSNSFTSCKVEERVLNNLVYRIRDNLLGLNLGMSSEFEDLEIEIRYEAKY